MRRISRGFMGGFGAAAAAAAMAMTIPAGPAPAEVARLIHERQQPAIVPEDATARAIGTVRRDRRDKKRRKALRFRGWYGTIGRNGQRMVRSGVPHWLAYGVPPPRVEKRRARGHAVGTGSAQIINHRP